MITKTIYNNNLRTPDRVRVRIGKIEKYFAYPSEKDEVMKFIENHWNAQENEQFFFGDYDDAYIYYDIDWDSDNILYCKYEKTLSE